MSYTPRPYQWQMIHDAETAWQLGFQNVALVLSTGGGKSLLVAEIVRRANVPTCIIAHRQELVGQLSMAVARCELRHGIIAANSTTRNIVRNHMDEFGKSWYEPSSKVKVASVSTIVRRDQNDPWFKSVKLWVIDELHHLQRDNIWGKATAMMPNARGLGVTATPIRADGGGLGRHADGLIDHMVEGPTMRELIDEGYLSDYEIYCPPNDLDLSDVPISAGGDFSDAPLRKAIKRSHIVGNVVEHYLSKAKGKLGVTFCVCIEACVEMCQAYRAAGIPAEVISGETPDFMRQSILRRFRNREIHQLVNVDIVSEGFDMPAIEVVTMARPTESFATYAQQFGRGLRPLPGKTHAIILDHVGNVVRHRGPPDMPRTWTLDRREKRGSSKSVSDAVPMRVCPQCTRPYERSEPTCPYCGHAPEPAGRSAPEQVDGDLTLLDRSVFERMWQAVDRGPRFPHGASMATVGRIKRDWFKKNEAQGELRDAMAQWGGVRRAVGDDDRRIQRRFFHTFGVDVLSAQALAASDAATLAAKVRGTL